MISRGGNHMTEENEVWRNKTTKFYTSEHGRDKVKF